MTDIIKIGDDEIRLSSNLDEYSFGKTNYETIIAQQGVFFDGKDFSSWSFSEVKSFDVEGKSQRIVFYCGKNPFSSKAKTLLEIFEQAENDDSEKKAASLFSAVKATCNALTVAAKSNKKIPMVGAGGIIIEENDSSDCSDRNLKALFLPQELFVVSANGLSQNDFHRLHSGWINQTIYDLPAVCFERAVITYRLLCQKLPYPCCDQTERNADILDGKFLPVQMRVKNIDEKLARAINKALKLNSNSVNVPGKKQKGKKNEDLTPDADFPENLLREAFELSRNQRKNPPEKEFFEKAEIYERNRDAKIRTKRKIRRNSAAIAVFLVVGAIIFSLIMNSVQTSRNSETSLGLTPEQTALGYFYGVNTKDTVLLANFTKGRKTQKYVDTVSQIYVLDKQRHVYEKDNGFASPENWLLFSTNLEKYSNSGIFGVTNLKINGVPVEIQINLPKKKSKPEPVKTENGAPIENKTQTKLRAEYFHIHSEGENNQFIVEKVFEDFTLTFERNRWLITEISTETATVPVSSIGFKNDYFNQLAINDGDVIAAAENLREKYVWLPTKAALQTEKERLQKESENPFYMFQ